MGSIKTFFLILFLIPLSLFSSENDFYRSFNQEMLEKAKECGRSVIVPVDEELFVDPTVSLFDLFTSLKIISDDLENGRKVYLCMDSHENLYRITCYSDPIQNYICYCEKNDLEHGDEESEIANELEYRKNGFEMEMRISHPNIAKDHHVVFKNLDSHLQVFFIEECVRGESFHSCILKNNQKKFLSQFLDAIAHCLSKDMFPEIFRQDILIDPLREKLIIDNLILYEDNYVTYCDYASLYSTIQKLAEGLDEPRFYWELDDWDRYVFSNYQEADDWSDTVSVQFFHLLQDWIDCLKKSLDD